MITIIDYSDKHQPYFNKFNRAWIEKFFWLEPIDEFVLGNPKEAILSKGGFILMALFDGEVAGTVALKKVSETVFEFTKMAVDEKYRNRGIAMSLSIAAINKAKEQGAKSIILFSHTSLTAAIALYKKLGFKEIPLEPGVYKRSDIKMELQLECV